MGRRPRREEEVDPAPPVLLHDDRPRLPSGEDPHPFGEAPAVVPVDADGVELHTGLAELETGMGNPITRDRIPLRF